MMELKSSHQQSLAIHATMTDYFMRAICFDAIPVILLTGFLTMPNYDYMCDDEGTLIVLDLPMDHKIPHCQVCLAPLRRVYTAVPFILKGSGWASKDG
jgi:predicted nucleic acid-binding Zn ribbon protein